MEQDIYPVVHTFDVIIKILIFIMKHSRKKYLKVTNRFKTNQFLIINFSGLSHFVPFLKSSNLLPTIKIKNIQLFPINLKYFPVDKILRFICIKYLNDMQILLRQPNVVNNLS